MATMFELTATLRQLLELAGSDDPDEQQAFADTLEAVSGEIGVKADSYKYVMDQLEGQAQKCKEAAQYLSDKAARIAENEKRIKETIMQVIEQMPADAKGKKCIQGDTYKFTIVKNGGKQPMKVDGDVPDNYMKIIFTPDNDKIRKELEAGKPLPFAHLEERGVHLNVR